MLGGSLEGICVQRQSTISNGVHLPATIRSTQSICLIDLLITSSSIFPSSFSISKTFARKISSKGFQINLGHNGKGSWSPASQRDAIPRRSRPLRLQGGCALWLRSQDWRQVFRRPCRPSESSFGIPNIASEVLFLVVALLSPCPLVQSFKVSGLWLSRYDFDLGVVEADAAAEGSNKR